MSKLSKKERKRLRRILAAAALLVLVSLLPEKILPAVSGTAVPLAEAGSGIPLWPLYLVPYLIIGYDVLYRAVRNIGNGQVFDENFLMGLATVGAFATGEYAEAVFVMLFYQVGE
ncbi:MAG: heavy metal translocating P-type ATPase, partial [Oscillospiraceae bacterium]|nr:heavy metal translocating P-type ATPase [Oscillospiraceae bacterium]